MSLKPHIYAYIYTPCLPDVVEAIRCVTIMEPSKLLWRCLDHGEGKEGQRADADPFQPKAFSDRVRVGVRARARVRAFG